jgi:flagellar biosynthesis/type III secretory pathway protein FliH
MERENLTAQKADEIVRETAHQIATEVAEEVAKEAYDEAFKEAYDEAFKEAYRPPADEHQPSCFALEEEKGEMWKGTGATRPELNESRPSL